MPRIGLWFLFAAVLCLIAGVSMGMYMGIVHDFTLAPVHAHLNLLGWASLALFGLSYRAWPELAQSRLALWHFAFSAPAAALFPAGIYMSMIHQRGGLVQLAAPMWMIGAVLFAAGVGRLAFGRQAAAAPVAATA